MSSSPPSTLTAGPARLSKSQVERGAELWRAKQRHEAPRRRAVVRSGSSRPLKIGDWRSGSTTRRPRGEIRKNPGNLQLPAARASALLALRAPPQIGAPASAQSFSSSCNQAVTTGHRPQQPETIRTKSWLSKRYASSRFVAFCFIHTCASMDVTPWQGNITTLQALVFAVIVPAS